MMDTLKKAFSFRIAPKVVKDLKAAQAELDKTLDLTIRKAYANRQLKQLSRANGYTLKSYES